MFRCWLSMRGCIKLWRPLLVAILLFSGSVFADTYPATGVTTYSGYPSTQAYCDANYGAGLTVASSSTGASGTCVKKSDNSPREGWSNMMTSYSCPAGGALSGTDCINAPSCVYPELRNQHTNACFLPEVCVYPEIDNGFGICGLTECPYPQVYDYVNHMCEGEQICSAAETLNKFTNLCELKPLNCPGHSHASTANDQCLADAPLTCPVGMHDDGAYNCVANDAPAPCNSDQQKGYINDIPQCVPKPNLDTKQQAAADKAAASGTADAAAKAAAAAAKTAADTAAASKAAADADPTNTTKSTQAANDAASSTSASASSDAAAKAAADDKSASDKADNDVKNAYAKATADGVRHIDDSINKASGKVPFSKSAPGTAPADGNVAIIDAKKVELRAMMGNVKAQFAGLTPTLSGGGAIACDAGINIPSLHISVSFCINSFMQYLPNLGTAIYFTAVFMALAIILV